jgi:hypothetical protein
MASNGWLNISMGVAHTHVCGLPSRSRMAERRLVPILPRSGANVEHVDVLENGGSVRASLRR